MQPSPADEQALILEGKAAELSRKALRNDIEAGRLIGRVLEPLNVKLKVPERQPRPPALLRADRIID